jgi:predicted lipoprotein
MRLWLALLIGLMATPALAQLHPTGRTVITQAVEDAIRPGFAAFAEAARDMRMAMGGLCDEPSVAGLEDARGRFRDVVLAWSRIENYHFGPLMKENRSERILFWPDRKGIALKQVQAILANKDATAADPATLKAKSVAVQGLGALEFVLFGTGAEALAVPEGDFRCDYGNAISGAVSDVATEMSVEWFAVPGIATRMMRPSDDDPDYRSNDEVLQELIGVMAHGVEAIRDQRILPFLGRDGAPPKPKSALFWRSNMTMPSILANFEGLRALLVNSDIWRYAPTEQFWIGEQAMSEFDTVTIYGSGVTGTVEEAMADPAHLDQVTDIVTSSQVLGKLVGEDLPAALGLSVGFSSLDGD